MVGHSFRIDEFPHKLHEVDGRHLAMLHQLVYVVYLDEILIFIQSWEGHLHYILQVLQTL